MDFVTAILSNDKDTLGLSKALADFPYSRSFNCFEDQAQCYLGKKLGNGGFGSVYLVRVLFKHPSDADYSDSELAVLNREQLLRNAIKHQKPLDVALKIVKAQYGLTYTLKEAFSMVSIPYHPGIVDLLHIETHPMSNEVYYFMEFVEGVDMQRTLKPSAKTAAEMSMHELLQISYDAVDALEYIHSFDIHHLDIKPANIMLLTSAPDEESGGGKEKHFSVRNGGGRVKIADFGIALSPDDEIDQTKSICSGTRSYMTPETRYLFLGCSKCSRYSIAHSMSLTGWTGEDFCCNAQDNYALALSLMALWLGQEEYYVSSSMANNVLRYRSLYDSHLQRKESVRIPKRTKAALQELLVDGTQNIPCTLTRLKEAISADARVLDLDINPFPPQDQVEVAEHFILHAHTLATTALIDINTAFQRYADEKQDSILMLLKEMELHNMYKLILDGAVKYYQRGLDALQSAASTENHSEKQKKYLFEVGSMAHRGIAVAYLGYTLEEHHRLKYYDSRNTKDDSVILGDKALKEGVCDYLGRFIYHNLQILTNDAACKSAQDCNAAKKNDDGTAKLRNSLVMKAANASIAGLTRYVQYCPNPPDVTYLRGINITEYDRYWAKTDSTTELQKYLKSFKISDDAIPDLYVDIDLDGKAHMPYETVIGMEDIYAFDDIHKWANKIIRKYFLNLGDYLPSVDMLQQYIPAFILKWWIAFFDQVNSMVSPIIVVLEGALYMQFYAYMMGLPTHLFIWVLTLGPPSFVGRHIVIIDAVVQLCYTLIALLLYRPLLPLLDTALPLTYQMHLILPYLIRCAGCFLADTIVKRKWLSRLEYATAICILPLSNHSSNGESVGNSLITSMAGSIVVLLYIGVYIWEDIVWNHLCDKKYEGWSFLWRFVVVMLISLFVTPQISSMITGTIAGTALSTALTTNVVTFVIYLRIYCSTILSTNEARDLAFVCWFSLIVLSTSLYTGDNNAITHHCLPLLGTFTTRQIVQQHRLQLEAAAENEAKLNARSDTLKNDDNSAETKKDQ
jgi:serine/threonine protein kinase